MVSLQNAKERTECVSLQHERTEPHFPIKFPRDVLGGFGFNDFYDFNVKNQSGSS